ncbi:MAG TPA: nuclear transport factor 2 family protein [Solirubrobacteraceae bacterium]|nr:nuclear transport factor 2 family protein [Solirubrobacteraceae bacterium]
MRLPPQLVSAPRSLRGLPRGLLTGSLAVGLAVSVGACGAASTSTSSFKGEQHAVAQAIADLQSHGGSLEAKKVCSEDLAAGVVAALNRSSEGCAKAIEKQLKQIDNFEVTVRSVKVSGAGASARVKSVHEGKQQTSTLDLVKENGRWKVSGVG